MVHFTPLHVHSHYSLLEGVDSPKTLLQRAAACGYRSLALTDTNNLYGATAFVEEARSQGVRPILGACLRHGKHRCTALIAEPAGYRSLCRILSRLSLMEEPSLVELLTENVEGLHVLVNEPALAHSLREAFGQRLWIELIRPSPSTAKERELLEASHRLGSRPVASSAAHFATTERYATFRLLAAIRQGKLLDNIPARLRVTPEHHLLDSGTLCRRFQDIPEAIINAEHLAAQCRSDVMPRGLVMPPAHVPKPHDAAGYLRLLCAQGLSHRHSENEDAARGRLEQELQVILQRDLACYFLVVRDIACEARRRGFSMALRGSAGNSLVCYLLGITNVDPLRFDLPMERFIHPGRPDLPDIDLDFDWRVRDDIIVSVFERYGANHTAMISSHLFLQPASAFREAAKAHGLSNDQISRLLETLSERVGALRSDAPTDLRQCVPRSFPLDPRRWPCLLAHARKLLDRPHHLSIHPGGVVITPQPIENYVPLQRAPKGVVITQMDKDGVEQIGLVKIDLLGNRALSTVNEARRTVKPTIHPCSNTGATDKRTVELLCRGDTLGVNQLESPAMRHLLIQMQPQSMVDVIQALALIRPGAANIGAKERFIRRRRGLEPVEYFHSSLEPLLRDTCGLMLYEDDALHVVKALTGFSLSESDRFRKQITKCASSEEMLRLSLEFLSACGRNGVPRSAAEEVWVQLAKFNAYSFCKSHAVSYGLIAWEAAYLKTHHPLPFWVAALNNNQGMYPRRVYIEAVKRAGIPVALPCINRSLKDFALEGDGIRTGLSAIGSLNEATGNAILEDRARRGPFPSLADFRRRVATGPEELALLIQVGAFDFTGLSRPAMILQAEVGDQPCQSVPLFATELSDDTDSWTPADYAQAGRWKDEWDRLGFLVGPPLMRLFRSFLPKGLHDSRSIGSHVGTRVRLAGLIAAARHTPTKRGEEMQFVTLEDEWGLIEVILFPGRCKPVASLVMGPYLVNGKVEEQHGVLSVTATRFERRELHTASHHGD